MLAFDLERQRRRANLRVQAVLAEIVAVEGHVQGAEGVIAAQLLEQSLGHPDAAGADADETRVADASFGKIGVKSGRHLADQFGGIGQAHGCSFLGPSRVV
ncbi:hypothetical protein D3C73_1117010 [compost metagenome]